MTGLELLIIAVVVVPFWLGIGFLAWWLTRRSRRANHSNPSVIPAGWHVDPHGRFELRYWDGARWTEHVSTAGHATTDTTG